MTDSNPAAARDCCVLEARMSMLPEAAAFVEAFCAREGSNTRYAFEDERNRLWLTVLFDARPPGC